MELAASVLAAICFVIFLVVVFFVVMWLSNYEP